jgi:hypothetical protein
MGFRFRKSVNLGPLRVNLSKSGVGYSVGGKGFRVTKKAKGGYRTTASVPGTGLSYVKEYGGGSKRNEKMISNTSYPQARPPKKPFPWGWVLFGFFILSALVFIKSWAAPFMFMAAILVLPKGPIAQFARNDKKFKVAQVLVILFCAIVGASLIPDTTGNTLPTNASSSYSIASISSSSTISSPSASTAVSSSAVASESISSSDTVIVPVTPAPTIEPTPSPATEPQTNMVWIAGSGDGTKYHSKSGCSSMKNPVQISLSDAQARGYTACARCH